MNPETIWKGQDARCRGKRGRSKEVSKQASKSCLTPSQPVRLNIRAIHS